jgi:hypothetical protein
MLPDRPKIIIDMKRKLKEGKTAHEISDFIKENYKVSNQNIIFLFKEAKQLLEREQDFNIRDTSIKNTARYEKIWKKNFSNPFSEKLDNPDDDLEDEDVRKTLFKIKNHYMTAAEALKAKEKLLGIVHNRMDVQLKNEYEENESDDILDVSKFDLKKLAFVEKLELLSLLKKAKGDIDESTETKVTTTVTTSKDAVKETLKYENVVDKFEIEDIEHEEVIENGLVHTSNVNKKIIEDEAKMLDDKINAQKDAERKVQFELNKKKLLEKYKEKK